MIANQLQKEVNDKNNIVRIKCDTKFISNTKQKIYNKTKYNKTICFVVVSGSGSSSQNKNIKKDKTSISLCWW